MEGWIAFFARKAEGAGSSNAAVNRVHIQISKKVVPTAVKRNRIRRLIKEVLRLEWTADPNVRYTFRVLKNPDKPDYWMVQNALQVYRRR